MSTTNQAGKGDRYRKVDGEKWRRNWERVYGKRKRRQEKRNAR